jgi:hypothetical protein
MLSPEAFERRFMPNTFEGPIRGAIVAILGIQMGGVAILGVTIAVGIRLRAHREPSAAETLSRVSHLAFWIGLVAPWALGLIWPGPAALDRLVGLPPLPVGLWVRLALGIPLLVGGVALMQASISGLKRRGEGGAGPLSRSRWLTRVRAHAKPDGPRLYTACVEARYCRARPGWLYTALGAITAHAQPEVLRGA